MTAKQFKALRDHFQQWSGGFPPESDDQITVYIDYALPVYICTQPKDVDEAREDLDELDE